MADPRICAIEGCGKKHWARGWCYRHYLKNHRYGDPTEPDKRRGPQPDSPEVRARKKLERAVYQDIYRRSSRGRAATMRLVYVRIDACDLTIEEVMEEFAKPCEYCGTTIYNRGLDRIDNALPHVKGNVLPACALCNIIRSDRFDVEEMRLLGKVIADIRAARPVDAPYRHHITGKKSVPWKKLRPRQKP